MTLVGGKSLELISDLTRTGITDPVTSLNSLCPMTRRIDAIAPEWLVKEMKSLFSSVRISSSSNFIRASSAEFDSRLSGNHSSSSSVKPTSIS